jgi:hypothetical protein
MGREVRARCAFRCAGHPLPADGLPGRAETQQPAMRSSPLCALAPSSWSTRTLTRSRSAPESGGLEALPEDGHGPALQGAVTSAELRSAELWVEEEEQVYDRPRTAANGILTAGNPAADAENTVPTENREKLFSALQHSAKGE